MSLTAISSLESARRKFFINSTSCLESSNQTFLGSGGQNESNSHQLARSGENKIFHELDIMSRKYESNVFGLRRPK